MGVQAGGHSSRIASSHPPEFGSILIPGILHEANHTERMEFTMSAPRGRAGEILWRPWSKEAFELAAKEGKLILVDLSAGWCHWCHVMDETTYSDQGVIDMINKSFVPVRVDIDDRPDISERYNRGGFPTTAFLSDRGESVWGATYIPPQDMRRILRTILQARESGEIDQALERSRMQYLDLSKRLVRQPAPDPAMIDTVFEDIFSAYDVENGGFGIEPKFPHPEVIDLLLQRYRETEDEELADAVAHTLDSMTQGIYDRVEGGVFRYSVTRDWRAPHYEKMLETNAGFLRNLVRAHKVLRKARFAETASGVATYLLDNLRDPDTGGFYGSQDADEEYYKLSCPGRRKVVPPEIIKVIYAGWNSEAATALIEAGVLLRDPVLAEAGTGAVKYSVANLWNNDNGLVRHSKGNELYLFEDQVAFMESLIAALEVSGDSKLWSVCDTLIAGVDRAFGDSEGGYTDILRSDDAVGDLSSTKKPLVWNSRWARTISIYGAAAHRPELIDKAWNILRSFGPREIEAHGLFAAPFVAAWWVLEAGPKAVEIRNSPKGDPLTVPLWVAAKEEMDPGAMVLLAGEGDASAPSEDGTFAVVCTSSGCSKGITDPEVLSQEMRTTQSSQF